MKPADIFERLWIQYSCDNPSAGAIYDLFQKSGERVVNDHVAFRTFDDPRVSLEVLARPFIRAGYRQEGSYRFPEKRLKARHFELPGVKEAPRVFISEMILSDFSEDLQNIVRGELDRLPSGLFDQPDLILQGPVFRPVSYRTYTKLRDESEYAAWLYVFGYRANHFTVSVNHLEQFESIQSVNAFLKEKGFTLNSSGGEVKGSPGQLLEQSSTLADRVKVEFTEGVYEIPSCYYEFARRYKDRDGRLFSGFIAGSADKIFESTDFR